MNDTTIESTETFFISISVTSTTPDTLSQSIDIDRATVNIIDDDGMFNNLRVVNAGFNGSCFHTASSIRFQQPSYNAEEGSNLTVCIQLSGQLELTHDIVVTAVFRAVPCECFLRISVRIKLTFVVVLL